MVNRKNLIAIGVGNPEEEDAVDRGDLPADTVSEEKVVDDNDLAVEPVEEVFPEASGRWILPAIALLIVAVWTGFFAFIHGNAMLAAAPAQWADWIADWSVPVLLVAVLWLLIMRNSRREALRFSHVANALSRESAQLEHRLITVNRELSLARDFIAAQSRDLQSLGRVAVDRLSANAQELQGLIATNGNQVENIARVSTTARDNMARLRDNLPVIANSARDVASQIAHAGNVAQNHMDGLVSGFGRLNEFGEASERQVTSMRTRVDDALAAFQGQAEEMERIVSHRFDALEQRNADFRKDMDVHEAESLASMRRRAEALRQELLQQQRDQAADELTAIKALRERIELVQSEAGDILAEMAFRQSDTVEKWQTSVADLRKRMEEATAYIVHVDSQAGNQIRQRMGLLKEEAETMATALTERLDAFDGGLAERAARITDRENRALNMLRDRLTSLDGEITERQQEHLAHISGLTERGTAMAQRLAELAGEMEQIAQQGHAAGAAMEATASGLTQSLSEAAKEVEQRRLAVARLTDDSVRLLELIRSSAEHGSKDLPRALTDAETRLLSFRADVQGLSDLVEKTGAHTASLASDLGSIQEHSTATADQLSILEQRIAGIARESSQLATRTKDNLSAAIASLEDASARQLVRIADGQAEEVRTLAERVAAESSSAIGDAVQTHVGSAINDLRESADHALHSGLEAANLLQEQLASVNELAHHLERRVAHARSRAQDQVDNDFSRRMALITESLNSAAIDISRAFDAEVTDAAWAGYLRGDRGIFTRRAVRLLDNQNIREISDLYETDGQLRETINRYIHDFEAMLRSILSTRDGNAFAVTLLSSDMGKLYVVLAQAIERLRD